MVLGFADLHNHQFANLAFGGRLVWGDPAGPAPTAVGSCAALHGSWGQKDLIGNVLRLVRHRHAPWHGTHGHARFDGWPTWDSYTHQTMYVDWLRRAVDGGLRLMVMLAVNSEWAGTRILGLTREQADDMRAVDAQLDAAWAFQEYVDESCGGDGKGWYRIVRSPSDARRVIAAGKLAVVLGIEVDNLFGARTGVELSRRELERSIERYYARGVRHIIPIHYGDNAFGGGAFDNPLVRDAGSPRISRRNPLGTVGAYPIRTEDGRTSGYEYRTGRRNVIGLSALGHDLIRALAERGMLVDINHMSERSKRDALRLCQQLSHPPMASHSGFVEVARGDRRHEGQLTGDELHAIVELGGMVGVILDQGTTSEIREWTVPGWPGVPLREGRTSNSVLQAYLYAVDRSAGRPVGIATDFNGFAMVPGPRHGDSGLLRYPFEAPATGATMTRSLVGDRAYGITEDGLAHIGLLPDLLADFLAIGLARPLLDPLLASAEAYLDAWSRAVA